MSKSNVDDLQKDIIYFFNDVLKKIIADVKDRDPILGENFEKRFLK
jgi:hypothetical protein